MFTTCVCLKSYIQNFIWSVQNLLVRPPFDKCKSILVWGHVEWIKHGMGFISKSYYICTLQSLVKSTVELIEISSLIKRPYYYCPEKRIWLFILVIIITLKLISHAMCQNLGKLIVLNYFVSAMAPDCLFIEPVGKQNYWFSIYYVVCWLTYITHNQHKSKSYIITVKFLY